MNTEQQIDKHPNADEVKKTFEKHQAVNIEFYIYTDKYLNSPDGQSYISADKDWPYETDSIEFSDVDYDMTNKHGDEYPDAIKEFSMAYFDLVAERFHASEGILIEAIHGYIKTLPEYQQKWKLSEGWMQVNAKIEDGNLLVIMS